jgi:hypothetical protein
MLEATCGLTSDPEVRASLEGGHEFVSRCVLVDILVVRARLQNGAQGDACACTDDVVLASGGNCPERDSSIRCVPGATTLPYYSGFAAARPD